MNENLKKTFRRVYVNNSNTLTLLGIFIILIAMFSITSPQYLSIPNLKSILGNLGIFGILLTGIVIVMISGGFDLSVGSVVGFVGVVIAKLFRIETQLPMILIIVIALLIGMGIGLLNGIIITKIRVNPLITTLGTLAIVRGFAYIWADEAAKIYNSAYINIARGYLFNIIPYTFFYVIGLFIIFSLILKFTKFGRNIYAVGGNENLARLAGINIVRVKIVAYVFSGLFSAMAAILMTGMLASGLPENGTGLEIEVVLIAIIGGIRVGGGKGNYLSTFMALVLLGSITNGLILMGYTSFTRMIVKGALLIFAISIDAARNRNLEKSLANQ